jgi:eukaryotic-like serine/threonine-protein kinase
MSTADHSPDSEEIAQQSDLLAVYRRTLAHLLRQAANYGGVSFAPPQTANGISEARAQIAQLKTALRGAGVVVENEPNDEIHQSPATPLDRQQQRNRRAMLEKVKTIWINGLLEQSLAEVAKIDLDLVDKPDAVDLPLNLQYQELYRQPYPLPPGTPIIDVFTQIDGALLILGTPGAGKTTLLLELARDLIARAEQDEGHPIPVIFNLSSWAEKCAPLVDWLAEELNIRYDVPRKIGRSWIDIDMVLPLLDGLDEVKQEQRALCVEAINTYRQEHGFVPLVVCSRIVDYEALTTKLRLRSAVLVQSLTSEQVDRYLTGVGENLEGVREALRDDAILRELSETPLMLSVMALAYQGMTAEELPATGSISQRRRHLFTAYVNRMFRRRGMDARYPQQQTIGWLHWLAQAMSTHAQTTFFLEHLQPDYLTNRSQRLQYAVGEGLAWGILAGLTAVIANGLVVFLGALTEWSEFRATPWLGHYLWSGWLGGLMGGLVGGLIGGLIARLTFDEAELIAPAADRRMSSVRNTLRVGITVGLAIGTARGLAVELAVGPPFGLIRGLGWGIGYGLAVGLGYGLITKPGKIEVVEVLKWSWSKARTQIIQALRYGIIVGLAVGLAVGIVNGIAWDLKTGLADGLVLWLATGINASAILFLIGGVSIGEIDTKTVPNQGIWRSAHNALRFGSAIWLISSFVMVAILSPFQSWGLSYALSFGIGGGFVLILVGGLLYGGIACIQHIVLLNVLWRTRKIPWRYSSFLDHCADLIFLRKVGGGYIFVHRLLMEHFTSLDDPASTSETTTIPQNA